MRPTLALFFGIISICLLSCKSRDLRHQITDTGKTATQTDSAAISSSSVSSPLRPCYVLRDRLDAPSYLISYTSFYLLPSGRWQHDSLFYLLANYITVTNKSTHHTDSLIVDSVDYSHCNTCANVLTDLSDKFQIKPFLLQLVIPGEDLTDNLFIGYREGRLQRLFDLGDTEGGGIVYTSLTIRLSAVSPGVSMR